MPILNFEWKGRSDFDLSKVVLRFNMPPYPIKKLIIGNKIN